MWAKWFGWRTQKELLGDHIEGKKHRLKIHERQSVSARGKWSTQIVLEQYAGYYNRIKKLYKHIKNVD